MATSDSTLVIDAETGKAMREMVKFAQTQEHVEKGNKKLGSAFKETTQHSDKMSAGFSILSKRLIAVAASFATFSTAAKVLETIDRTMSNIAKSSDIAAKGFLPFSVQIAGQPGAADTLRKAKVTLANLGVERAQGGALANMIYATQGADFAKDLPLAGRMVGAMGVSPEAAGNLIGTAVMRRMPTDLAASQFLKATDLAKVNPEQMARVVGKTTGYTSMAAGLGIATALAPVIEPEQLPAAVEAASRMFMKDESLLAKKFKLGGLDERQRLEVLASRMGQTGDEQKFIRSVGEKYGLGEEEGRAMRALLMGRGLYSENLATIQAAAPGGIEGRYQAMRSDDPAFRAEYDARRARLLGETRTEYGPLAAEAREKRALDQSIALTLQRNRPTTGQYFIDESTGEAGFWGRRLFRHFIGREIEQSGATAEDRRELEIKKAVYELETGKTTAIHLMKALEDNTAATRENTQQTNTPARNANL